MRLEGGFFRESREAEGFMDIRRAIWELGGSERVYVGTKN